MYNNVNCSVTMFDFTSTCVYTVHVPGGGGGHFREVLRRNAHRFGG